jgi:hypothetical protein
VPADAREQPQHRALALLRGVQRGRVQQAVARILRRAARIALAHGLRFVRVLHRVNEAKRARPRPWRSASHQPSREPKP